MRAISITQPWASMIAHGEKRIETRSWSTRYRGPLAIHAAKNLAPVSGLNGLINMLQLGPFDILQEHWPLPLGAVVATCMLRDCIPTGRFDQSLFDDEPMVTSSCGQYVWTLTPKERAVGDFSPGRYAWLLSNIKFIVPGIPLQGKQGIWEIGDHPHPWLNDSFWEEQQWT